MEYHEMCYNILAHLLIPPILVSPFCHSAAGERESCAFALMCGGAALSAYRGLYTATGRAS